MDTWTDEDGNTHTDTYEVQVPYDYYILNVKLTNKSIHTVANSLLTPEQTGKTYDCVAVIDDTGGQYVNFTMEFATKKEKDSKSK